MYAPHVAAVGPRRPARTFDYAVSTVRRDPTYGDSPLAERASKALPHDPRRSPATPRRDDLREEEGLEVEVESEDAAEFKRPLDPQKVKVQSTTLSVRQLVGHKEEGKVWVPEFHRMADTRTVQENSRLIESLLLRIPIPMLCFAADESDNWAVVDGLWRTSTICDFVAGKFALRGLEYFGKCEGTHYAQLDRPMQRRIEETSLTALVTHPSTPAEVTFSIFSRIHTVGVPLSAQQLRHVLHRGVVLEFLKELAHGDAFIRATGGSVSDERMGARECVLRFMAFRDRKWTKYSASDDLNRWLGSAMNDINQMTDAKRASLQGTFERTMSTAREIFGEHAFRRRYGNQDTRRRPVNKALFEAWSVGLAGALDSRRELVARRDEVVAAWHKLMQQPDFEAAVSTATGTASKVKRRFAAIETLIEECLRR